MIMILWNQLQCLGEEAVSLGRGAVQICRLICWPFWGHRVRAFWVLAGSSQKHATDCG